MPHSTCTFPQCEKPARCRGWCSAHYERWRKHGDPAVVLPPVYPPSNVRTQTTTCQAVGCGKTPWARNLCSTHYQKLRKHGDPNVDMRRKPTHCTVADCGLPAHAHGLCRRHYLRVRNTGSVTLAPRRASICSVQACTERTHKRAWHCESHYMELRRYGEVGGNAICADCSDPISRGRRRCKDCARKARLLASKNLGHVRRALIRGANAERFNVLDVYDRDEWVCGLCLKPVDPNLRHPNPFSASLDHILPLTRGGAHALSNVQLAHLRCNTAKGNRLPIRTLVR